MESRDKLNSTLNWWKDKINYLNYEHTTFESESDEDGVYILKDKEKYGNFNMIHYGSIININYEVNQIRSDKYHNSYYDRYIEFEFNLKDIFDLRIEEQENKEQFYDKIYHLKFKSIYGKRCFKIIEIIKRDVMEYAEEIIDDTPLNNNEFILTNKITLSTKNKEMAEKFAISIMGVVNLLNEKIE